METAMTAHETMFRAQRTRDEEVGLIDLKFFKSPFWEGTAEEFMAASNLFDAAEGEKRDDVDLIFEQSDIRPLLA